MVAVRAVYHQGQFQLLDPVNLQEGQQVQLQIVTTDEPPLRDLIADLLTPFDPSLDTAPLDEEAVMDMLNQSLHGKRPLSEIIMEDR